MEIINVEDPENLAFPMDRKTWENLNIFYHGTSKIYCSQIEENGFVQKWKPYDNSEIDNLVQIYEKLNYPGTYPPQKRKKVIDIDVNHPTFWPDLSICRTFASISNRTISFSGNYWLATHYANYVSGETIDGLVSFAENISEFYKMKEELFHPESTEDEILFDELNMISEKMISKYKNSVKHEPCVYVVELDDEQDHYLELRKAEEEADGTGCRLKNFEVTRDVPKESLIARIDFPNGGYNKKKLYQTVLRHDFGDWPGISC